MLVFEWLKEEGRLSKQTTSQVFVFVRGRQRWMHVNDPSAGSPTETLLRLLLPLNGKVWVTSLAIILANQSESKIREPHRTIQSVGATGGVYKGQGRNQRELMTHTY